jgi:release factor glutamine methyltransferase
LSRATEQLSVAGVDTPQLDAELLLAHSLGKNRTYLAAHLHDLLALEVAAAFHLLVARRAASEPLPYLLGRWEFLGLSFEVAPGVLIPRPETEGLVEAVAARAPAQAQVLDVGTGSGCIAIGLAHMRSDLRVTSLEISPAAAAIARRNVVALGVADRVEVVEGAFPEAAPAGPFEVVVSNPPYIAGQDIEALAPEVRDHEPRGALDGGSDGLLVLRALADRAGDLLLPGGLLALEIGVGQAELVAALLESNGWQKVEVQPDLAGIPRIVLASHCD